MFFRLQNQLGYLRWFGNLRVMCTKYNEKLKSLRRKGDTQISVSNVVTTTFQIILLPISGTSLAPQCLLNFLSSYSHGDQCCISETNQNNMGLSKILGFQTLQGNVPCSTSFISYMLELHLFAVLACSAHYALLI